MIVESRVNELALAEYFQKRLDTFRLHFENTKVRFDIEDLHRLRVEIKKLRAFFRMFELATENTFQKKEHLKLLATIFKPGGRLRETQVNLSMVSRYTSYLVPYYKVFLVKREERQIEKLKIALANFDVLEFERLNSRVFTLLELIDLEVFKEKSFAFISNEIKAIRSLMPGISKEKELHKIRMHLKAMGYITKLTKEINTDEKLAGLLLAIKPTETLIGNWHDRVVLVLSLKRFLRKNEENPNKEEIERLIAQIEKRNIVAVEEISLRLNKILQAS